MGFPVAAAAVACSLVAPLNSLLVIDGSIFILHYFGDGSYVDVNILCY